MIKEGYHIWPIHYGEHQTMHRVTFVKEGRVVYERIFNTLQDAEKYIKRNESI